MGRVVLPAGRLPYTEDEIPSANRIVWMDPSFEGAVVSGSDVSKPQEVSHVFMRGNDALQTSDGSLYFTSPYSDTTQPVSSACDRRVRLVDGWLDFSAGYGEGWANFLLAAKLPHEEITNFTSERAQTLEFKSGFVVLDSSRGGGTLMSTTIGGTTAPVMERYSVEQTKIWNIADSTPRTISSYLDGTKVNGDERAFSGRKEVFSFDVAGGETLKAKAFGWGDTKLSDFDNHELFGEWILYSENLPSADREGVEAYLMAKWLGKMRSGFSETREMTVSGGAVIEVPDVAHMPKVSETFTGTLEVQAPALSFTVRKGADRAENAIDLAGRRLAFASDQTVDIAFDGDCASGVYTLITAGELDQGAGFTVGTVTLGTRNAASFVKLVVTSDGVDAVLQRPGLVFVVR
jgi:hypothetical protein